MMKCAIVSNVNFHCSPAAAPDDWELGLYFNFVRGEHKPRLEETARLTGVARTRLCRVPPQWVDALRVPAEWTAGAHDLIHGLYDNGLLIIPIRQSGSTCDSYVCTGGVYHEIFGMSISIFYHEVSLHRVKVHALSKHNRVEMLQHAFIKAWQICIFNVHTMQILLSSNDFQAGLAWFRNHAWQRYCGRQAQT